jgi:isopenicillin-N epimerase
MLGAQPTPMPPSAPALPPQSPFRRHWSLAPDLVFLNHGSFGACPAAILDLQHELRRTMEASPVEFLHRRYDERMAAGRVALAEFLGVRTADLAPVTNATTAVNAVARSWRLAPGDQVLTTSHDYNACRNALEVVARSAGGEVVVAELPFPVASAEEVVAAVLGAVTPRTRYAMIDHVTSGSALVLPVEIVVRELEDRGIRVLVDGAHAPGMLEFDMEALGASWYCGNLHKWTCAPKGCAFLWAREDMQEVLQPAVVSHGNNTPRPGYTPFQDRFDWPGTWDPTPWMCLPAVLDFVGGLLPGGWRAVREHNRALGREARLLLMDALGVVSPCPEDMLGSMATLPLPERFQGVTHGGPVAPEQLRLHDEFRIEVPFVRCNGARGFRVSAHLHNRIEEYRYLAECLGRI